VTDPFLDLLATRAERAGVVITTEASTTLGAYFRLLKQWNKKINLTSLVLDPPTDQTIDRLFIEPLAAARLLGDFSGTWFDIGSGGGSPAIPLRIVQPHARLTMVESRTRKSAFLREAVRVLGLTDATVSGDRLESLAVAPHSVDLITVRGVRCDAPIFAILSQLLTPSGRALIFHSAGSQLPVQPHFSVTNKQPLGTPAGDELTFLSPMFHVEQSD
jgi:16S rRNA (guanine527-N7)-methyltransferase